MMSYETILFAQDGGIARLTLNRPDRLNSFTDAMHAEVRDALGKVRADGSARVLLLTGAGRGFCAGQDLARPRRGAGRRAGRPRRVDRAKLQAAGADAARAAAAGRLRGERRRRRRRRQPGARLRHRDRGPVGELHRGVLQARARSPIPAGTYFLPRLVGTARAMGLALLGDKLSAEQAAAWGLIWQCVDDAELPAAIERLLAHFATAPTHGLARTKEALYASPANTLEAQLDLERDLMRELGYSDDYREGVAAFIAKRPPHFSGR